MKRFRRLLKWTGLVVLFLVLSLTLVTAARQHLTYEAPYPEIAASRDSAIIQDGRHLVLNTAHCVTCHYKGNADSLIALGQDVPLTGGYEFALPVGKIYSKNITPDPETGIGRYSDAEIARMLRYGVKANGNAVFDFMPFHNMSDEDLKAIISYLRSQKSVYNQVPANRLNLLGYVVNAYLVKPVGPSGPVPARVNRDSSAEYGAYLALNVSECNGCHTLRDMTGKYIGEPFAGGNEIEGFVTPNLTPDSSSRIFGWTQKQFIARFRKGRLIPGSPMPWGSFSRLKNEELAAIYNYLRTVKPARTVIP